MKRVALVGLVAIVLSFAMSRVLIGQGDPFFATSERGQLVHVLPPPALIRPGHDPSPMFAPDSASYSVYRASYGAGNLQYHGGPEITSAGFRPIYWNSAIANNASTNSSLGYTSIQAQVGAFVTHFPDNSNWDGSATDDYEVIQQYSTGGTPIVSTLTRGSDYVDTKQTQQSITDSAIQNYLTTLFNNSATTGVTANANTIYGVYFPPNMSVTLGSSASCTSFCGYHSAYSYNGVAIKYAVFPYPGCSGCSISGLSAADMLTIVTSHEIREAVTDPSFNNNYAWYDAAGYEADDKCAWHNLYQMRNGGFWVQPEYSNGLTYNGTKFPAQPNGKGGCVVPK